MVQSVQTKTQTVRVASAAELVAWGQNFGAKLKAQLATHNLVIELIGDVGAGKTTLVRGIAGGLGVAAEITSPSFTICKKYPFREGLLSHYDFYRLPDPGIMRDEIAEALAEPGAVVAVEWGADVTDLLPDQRFIIAIKTLPDAGRELTITSPAS